jgi:hypothetical protein
MADVVCTTTPAELCQVRRNSIVTAFELKRLLEDDQDVLKEPACMVVQRTREPEMEEKKSSKWSS